MAAAEVINENLWAADALACKGLEHIEQVIGVVRKSVEIGVFDNNGGSALVFVEAYLGLGITDEAETAAAVLGHNFPNSEWYQDAYNLLKGKGLSPHEYNESWISKIWHTVVPS